MKLVIALFCMILCFQRGSTSNKELDEAWSRFKHVYKKHYVSIEDETNRRNIWEMNLAMIRKHNLQADMNMYTYTLKMNQFGDLTNEEINHQMNGLKMDLRTNNYHVDRHTFMAPLNILLPTAIDWRTHGYVTPVKDQGQCGSCWSFSATGSLEGQTFAKRSRLIPLSEQNLIDCSYEYGNRGCHGGVMELAFLYIKQNNGIDTEESYPYEARNNSCRFDPRTIGATDTGFVQIRMFNETDLQAAIATVGPISVSIDDRHSSFHFYASGVYDEPQCSPINLHHAVLAVGYDTCNKQEYYIVKNSWGTTWGNAGYIWMSRNKKNQCGIATMASYPLV